MAKKVINTVTTVAAPIAKKVITNVTTTVKNVATAAVTGVKNAVGWIGDQFRGVLLNQIHKSVVKKVDSAITATNTKALEALGAGRGEIANVLKGGSQSAKFRGSIIDTAVKQQASNTFGLKSLVSPGRFQYGPDFWNPKTMRAWDMTTPKQWGAHVKKYITDQPSGKPVWKSLTGLFH